MKIVYLTHTNQVLYMMPDTDTVTITAESVTLVRSLGGEDLTTVLTDLNSDNATTATLTAEEFLMGCDLSAFVYLGG